MSKESDHLRDQLRKRDEIILLLKTRNARLQRERDELARWMTVQQGEIDALLEITAGLMIEAVQ